MMTAAFVIAVVANVLQLAIHLVHVRRVTESHKVDLSFINGKSAEHRRAS